LSFKSPTVELSWHSATRMGSVYQDVVRLSGRRSRCPRAGLVPSCESLTEVSTLQNSAPDQDRGPSPQPRRILAIVNPIAGPRGVPRNPKDLMDRAEKLGVPLQVVETRPGAECEALISALDGSFDCLLAVGGDGTVMEVAQAAMKRGLPLAILP